MLRGLTSPYRIAEGNGMYEHKSITIGTYVAIHGNLES